MTITKEAFISMSVARALNNGTPELSPEMETVRREAAEEYDLLAESLPEIILPDEDLPKEENLSWFSGIFGKVQDGVQHPVLQRQLHLNKDAAIRGGKRYATENVLDMFVEQASKWLSCLPFVGHFFRTETKLNRALLRWAIANALSIFIAVFGERHNKKLAQGMSALLVDASYSRALDEFDPFKFVKDRIGNNALFKAFEEDALAKAEETK